MRVVAAFCVLALVVGVSGCSSSSSSTGPSGKVVQSCGGGNASGSMTATISGRSFEAQCLVTLTFNGKLFDLAGTDVSQSNSSTFQIVAFVVSATGPGTYTIDSTTIAQGASGNNASYNIGGNQLWNSGAGFGGGGTVTFTTLTTTSASGTFSINFVAGPSASGTKSLTNGKFSVTF
jgi:hypothetical protein